MKIDTNSGPKWGKRVYGLEDEKSLHQLSRGNKGYKVSSKSWWKSPSEDGQREKTGQRDAVVWLYLEQGLCICTDRNRYSLIVEWVYE